MTEAEAERKRAREKHGYKQCVNMKHKCTLLNCNTEVQTVVLTKTFGR